MKGRLLVPVAAIVLAGMSAACGARQVEVRTAPSKASQVTLEINNSLTQAANVYIVSGGAETFVRQVAANSKVSVPVQGFAPGTTVGLKAVSVDGTRTFSRANVVLSGAYQFAFP